MGQFQGAAAAPEIWTFPIPGAEAPIPPGTVAVASRTSPYLLGTPPSQKRLVEGRWGYTASMTAEARQLLKQALALDEKDRASLAGMLIESLHAEADPGAEAAWDAEIRRRVEDLDSGKVETIPWPEVRQRLFRDLD